MEKISFYEHIKSNKRKSIFLISIVIGVIIFLGYVIGILFVTPGAGISIAVIISIIFTLLAYYTGDNLVLSAVGAREATKQEFPFLINTVEGLSIAAGLPVPKIYVIDDNSINAFATGRDPKHSSVAVTTGALEKLNRAELEGVLGHEMSHIQNYDVRFMLLTTVLVGVVVLLADFMIRAMFFSNRDREGGNAQMILIVVALLLAVLSPIFMQLIVLAVSRKREYLADASGAKLTRHPAGLAEALKKIKADSTKPTKTANKAMTHMYISNPFKGKGHWFSTHPDVDSRIERL